MRLEISQVEEAEAAWEKFHRAAIEKTIKHGDHKAFPHMILNAGQAPSNGYRVGQKAAVQLSQGGKASKPRREMLR